MPKLHILRDNNVFGTGFAFGLDTLSGLEFDKDKPFRACLLCGALYQARADRVALLPKQVAIAAWERQKWATKHAKQHTTLEHEQFKASKLLIMPLAAKRLAPFGVIPIGDSLINEEIQRALFESNPIPDDDAES